MNFTKSVCFHNPDLPGKLRMVILPLQCQPFQPPKKNTLASQKITIDDPQQELGVNKILTSSCGHAAKAL